MSTGDKGKKISLDKYRSKSDMGPGLPNDPHDLRHSIPILLISGEVTQALELKM